MATVKSHLFIYISYCLFYFCFLLYFFHYHLAPLYPHHNPALTTLLSMPVTPFSFLVDPSIPSPAPERSSALYP